MPKAGTGFQNGMTTAEMAILKGFIATNKAEASDRTKAKVSHFVFKMVDTLHRIRPGVTLDAASYDDLKAIVPALKNSSGNPITKNSRQSFVTTLKALVEYMEMSRKMKISGDKYSFSKVKGGAPSRDNKAIISPEDFQKVLSCKMTTKERAIISLMWDGCLRPGEPLALCWSDFKLSDDGLSYKIRFKTDKERSILVSQDAKAVVEQWRMASGANYGDKTPVFPDRSGSRYETIEPVVKLFRRLRAETGFDQMTPGCIRNSAITRDCDLGYSTDYICRRCWGEATNDMLNIYMSMARTIQAQRREQDRLNGTNTASRKIEPLKVANLKPCPKCGIKNLADGVFCTSCGASMDGRGESKIIQMERALADMRGQLDAVNFLRDPAVIEQLRRLKQDAARSRS